MSDSSVRQIVSQGHRREARVFSSQEVGFFLAYGSACIDSKEPNRTLNDEFDEDHNALHVFWRQAKLCG